MLKNILVAWSDPSKDITASAKPEEILYYLREGFRAGEAFRCMIRPCDEYRVEEPTKANTDEIAELFQVHNSFLAFNMVDNVYQKMHFN